MPGCPSAGAGKQLRSPPASWAAGTGVRRRHHPGGCSKHSVWRVAVNLVKVTSARTHAARPSRSPELLSRGPRCCGRYAVLPDLLLSSRYRVVGFDRGGISHSCLQDLPWRGGSRIAPLLYFCLPTSRGGIQFGSKTWDRCFPCDICFLSVSLAWLR